jgi:hypothetical protein
MDEPSSDLGSMLLLRLWFEPTSPGLRARVIRTVDLRLPGEGLLLYRKDDIVAAVVDWIEACEARDRPE